MPENENASTAEFTISREDFDAVLFDLDGVITKTARVHAAAWKTLFDVYLEEVTRRTGVPFDPFDVEDDYKTYVDGKPRYQGVQSFLDSRGVHLHWGSEDDPPSEETICGLGNRKNEVFHQILERDGVEVFGSAGRLIRKLRDKDIRVAVVSSSKNCEVVLQAAGLADEFDVRVDGNTASELGLSGKPDPDTFLAAALQLSVEPQRAVVVEDASSGVEAGKRGSFGLVIGRGNEADRDALEKHGADVVLDDLDSVPVR